MTLGKGGEGEGIGANGWGSTLEVRQLRAFLAVVAHGSVSSAALALGLAQSTVSEALAALDRAVGAQTILRRRGAHETMLTDAGKTLLPHARRVLQELDAVHVAIAGVTHGASASVDVVANESVSTFILTPALGALRKRWPNTRFAVTVATCANVRAGVAEGQCNLGLLLENYGDTPGNPEAIETRRPHRHTDRPTNRPTNRRPDGAATTIVLASDIPLVIFAGTRHPLVRGARRGVLPRDAIASFPMFVADAAGDFHELIRRYFAADGLPGPRLEPVGSIDGVKRGVDADASALGILPLYAVAEDLRSGRVHALELSPAPPRMHLVALLPAVPGERHPAITELVEQLSIA